jgi:hypothetical protein
MFISLITLSGEIRNSKSNSKSLQGCDRLLGNALPSRKMKHGGIIIQSLKSILPETGTLASAK